MNNLYKRITEYIQVKQIESIRQFEVTAGIANGTIGKLENNPEKGLTTKTLNKISRQFKDLNIEWLCSGTGNMIVGKGPANDPKDDIIAKQAEEIENLRKVLRDLL